MNVESKQTEQNKNKQIITFHSLFTKENKQGKIYFLV